MLRPDQVEQIEQMIVEGRFSLRAIARKLGVGRGTVIAIAHGKRRRRTTASAGADDGLPSPDGPYVRCPTCGHRVQMPCLACRLGERSEAMRIGSAAIGPSIAPLGLELKAEHAERYQEVRAARLQAASALDARRRYCRALRLRRANLASMALALTPPEPAASGSALSSAAAAHA